MVRALRRLAPALVAALAAACTPFAPGIGPAADGLAVQHDALADTVHDADRCAAAALLFACARLGGDLVALARAHGLPGTGSVDEVHRLQDRLHAAADRRGSARGLLATTVPEFAADGRRIGWHVHADDELQAVLTACGLEREPLFGPSRARLHDRSECTAAALAAPDGAVLLVGCHAPGGGRSAAAATAARPANHMVVVWRRSGEPDCWLFDPALPTPASVRALTAVERDALLLTNGVPPYLLRRTGGPSVARLPSPP
jgi:hypothetical protein